jgi:DNA anti-recombination protein RmuC
MNLGLVAAWKQVKAKRKTLSDPKFKPDLGALLTKFETDFNQADDLKKQIDALKSGLLPFIKAVSQARKETKDQIEAARGQITDKAGSDYTKFLSDYGDGGDWDGVQKACAAYTDSIKKTVSSIDDLVKQLTKSRDTSSKDEITGIAQYITKRKQVEDKYKKAADERDKLMDQIPQVIGTYIKVAKQMKDDDLADDINAISKKMPAKA